jgi:hypothetical protein
VETEMSEPTQAQVKKTIARLRADMKYQESIGRDCYAENVTMKDVLIVCTAAEHSLAPATPTESTEDNPAKYKRKDLEKYYRWQAESLAAFRAKFGVESNCRALDAIDALIARAAAPPATPTHLALFDKLRDEWNGEIEPGQPCFDTFSACLAGLSDAIEKSRAAAPPATQTGDVRKGE